jgi:tRNA 5-methylaminomethyl-2-thiouridine biosynthesis bifunctional protein
VAEHDAGTLAAMPPFPVNGHGNLVPDFPSADRAGAHQWIMGSTFERDVTELPPTAADQQAAHASNGEKLAALLPGAGRRCAPSSMLTSARHLGAPALRGL